MSKNRLPAISHLVPVLRAIKEHVPRARDSDAKDYIAEGDTLPGIDVTIGWDKSTGDWSYQTGDTSFTGGAYGYPIWATGRIYKQTEVRQLARDLINQLDEATWV